MFVEIFFSILSFILAFFVSLGLTKWWIKISRGHKEMLQPDMNKYKSKPTISKAGGIAVTIAIVLSILVYIFFKTFILHSPTHEIETLSIVVTLLLACFVGFIDDIFGWGKSSISGYKKILMTIPIAIPLMVINAGQSIMAFPFLGAIDFGIVYPLIIVPLAIIGTTNGFNLLAGFNGMEAGLGVVSFAGLGILAYMTGQMWLVLIAGVIVSALLGFLVFNKNPAKIFPGNTLTYIIGGLFGSLAIIGNMEKAALIIFIPFILEGFLKLRSRFKAWNFGIPSKDNSLESRYKKNYSLTHIALRILKKIKPSHKVYENDITYFIISFEIVLAIIAIIVSI
ncbi:MAG: glycosyl transferase family 4 [Candidatus Pacearchaeota archaeon]|nr:glycosyl transferase family 4 [Candidatus Pacearchaeota archaeon]